MNRHCSRSTVLLALGAALCFAGPVLAKGCSAKLNCTLAPESPVPTTP